MWRITKQQAAAIYARYCQARYGGRARRIAAEEAARLRRRGDAEGERIWKDVEHQIPSDDVKSE